MAQVVGLRVASWTAEVEAMMQGATGSNPTYTVAELRAEVERGQTQLFQVVEGDNTGARKLGYVCLWIDRFGNSPELVLQAGAALQGEKEAFRKALPSLRRVAVENGCSDIRIHVEGAGRVRMFKSCGFAAAETVMRLKV